jgi:hypothetical protein
VAGLVGFAWLELIYVNRDQPSTLAWLSLGYFVVMIVAMLTFGVERWEAQGDGFAVYFNIASRLAPLKWYRRTVYARRPLSGITGLDMLPGTVAVICAIIGTTTFDGASNGALWRNVWPSINTVFSDLGFSATPAQELSYTAGLLFCVAFAAAIYLAGVWGMRTISHRYGMAQLTRGFAHTLAPIAIGYVFAHYFSLLIWQGQAMGYLISDPLGHGSNIFGTANWTIDYNVISFAAIWYVQVAALVAGHVGGLTLAHDRALAVYRNAQEAVHSQYWMLVVMVAFTCFGLWLLSAVGT